MSKLLQKRLFNLKEAANYLGVSPFTLRRMVWDHEIPAVQREKWSRVLFDVKDLDRWIEANKK